MNNFNTHTHISQTLSEQQQIINSDHHFLLLKDICNGFYDSLSKKNYLNSAETFNSIINATPPLTTISTTPNENLPLSEILSSTNLILNKIISVFTIVFTKIEDFIPNDGYDILYPFTVYGETIEDDDSIPEGAAERQISLLLPSIISLNNKANQLFMFCIHLLQQLTGIFDQYSKIYIDSFKNIILEQPLNYLGKMYSFFNIIDLIVNQNQNLSNHWKLYRFMMLKCKDNPSEFGFKSKDEYIEISNTIEALNSSIFSGNFLGFANKKILESVPTIFSNKVFVEYVYQYMSEKSSKLYNEIDSITEVEEKKKFVDVLSLLPFLKDILEENKYKEVFFSLWKFQYKVFIVPLLSCGVDFVINEFMLEYPPKSKKYLDPKNIDKTAQEIFNLKISEFSQNIFGLENQVLTWTTKMNSDLFDHLEGNDYILLKTKIQTKAIISGLVLASQLKAQLVFIFSSLTFLQIEMKDELLSSVVKGIEMIKCIESQFEQSKWKIGNNFSNIIKFSQSQLGILFDEVEKSLLNRSKSNLYYSEMLSCVEIIKSNLKGVPSRNRIIVNNICFDIIKSYLEYYHSNTYEEILFNFWKISLLSNFDLNVAKFSDTSFLYWFRDVIPDMFKFCYTVKDTCVCNIPFIARAVGDTKKILNYAFYVEDIKTFLADFENKVCDYFEQSFLSKLSNDIEIDIREKISIQTLDSVVIEPEETNNLVKFLLIKPFQLFSGIVDIKNYVRVYLNKIFYNMNVLNLNDFGIYQKMRKYCELKYKIKLHEVVLPFRPVNNDVFDLIQIIRHVNLFSKNYVYDFHSQIFIEKVSIESPFVQTIAVEQIIVSFQTYGIGIINTVVNKIFQVISTNLKSFLTIILDDNIRSLLRKEKDFWLDQRIKLKSIYNFNLAENFFQKNEFLIQKLTGIITQIGNLLGLVRLIKTGLMRHNLTVNQQISNKGKIEELLERVKLDTDSEIEMKFAETKGIYCKTNEIISEATNINYLNVLLSSFEETVSNQNILSDVQLFYLLIPSISLYFMNKIIIGKENISKSNCREGYYVDDGLMMGVVFLAKLFKIENLIESIHWFVLEEEKFQSKEEENGLMIQRKKAYKVEFQSVCFVYESASILYTE